MTTGTPTCSSCHREIDPDCCYCGAHAYTKARLDRKDAEAKARLASKDKELAALRASFDDAAAATIQARTAAVEAEALMKNHARDAERERQRANNLDREKRDLEAELRRAHRALVAATIGR